MKQIQIICWNVNGIRSVMKKNKLYDLINNELPNILCLSETQLSHPFNETEIELREKIKGYRFRYWNTCNIKKGYSGTVVLSKMKPLDVVYGFGDYDSDDEGLDQEGRIITCIYKDFILVHVYTPNSGKSLKHIDYRTKIWDVLFHNFLIEIISKYHNKKLIVCGDLNVAHKNIDIYNPSINNKNPGFTKKERNNFDTLLNEFELIDTYRYINPLLEKYSYWSYMNDSRRKNKGWRVDYFLVTKYIINNIISSDILTDIHGSDHAPIRLKICI